MRAILLVLLTLHVAPLLSQQKNLWLNRHRTYEVERLLAKDDSSIQHTALRPLLESKFDVKDNGEYLVPDRKYYYNFGTKSLKEHLIEIEEGDFHLTLDPLFDFGANHDFNDTLQLNFKNFNIPAINTRGALLQADIGDNFSFQSMLYETQFTYPLFLYRLADSLNVIPGQGRFKRLERRKLDYNQSYGWMSITPAPWINIQAGHGKHMIGQGYRSMLLSDGAFNYPFIRSTLWLLEEKLQYSWMYAGLQTLERLPLGDVPESLFRRKAMSMAYLSWSPIPQIEIGFFESVIWQRWDSISGTLPLDARSLIPVIGANTAFQGYLGDDHVVTGLNLRVTLPIEGWVYGQLVTDKPGENRFGYQVGVKLFDVFTPRFHLQAEYNFASDDLFKHPLYHQEYSHFNQSLAHPSGTNFEEVILSAYYQYRRWFIDIRQHWLDHDLTASGSILPGATTAPEFDFSPFYARSTVTSIQLGAMLNPKTNMNFSVGYQYRDQTIKNQVDVTNWVWLRLRTSLWNNYTDF